jgi:hypothetical protein
MPQQPNKLVPAVWGGLLMGVISGVPFLSWINCACCAGVMAGGALAVYLFRRQLDPRYHMDMGDGASLGLLAGVFGAIIGTALNQVFTQFSFELAQKILSEFVQDPEAEALIDQLRSSGSLVKKFAIIGFFMQLVLFTIFGLLGGLIGVRLFGKSQRPPYYPPVPPPSPEPTPTDQDSSVPPLP